MAGLGMLMVLLGVVSAWLRWRGRLYTSKPFLRFALLMALPGWSRYWLAGLLLRLAVSRG